MKNFGTGPNCDVDVIWVFSEKPTYTIKEEAKEEERKEKRKVEQLQIEKDIRNRDAAL